MEVCGCAHCPMHFCGFGKCNCICSTSTYAASPSLPSSCCPILVSLLILVPARSSCALLLWLVPSGYTCLCLFLSLGVCQSLCLRQPVDGSLFVFAFRNPLNSSSISRRRPHLYHMLFSMDFRTEVLGLRRKWNLTVWPLLCLLYLLIPERSVKLNHCKHCLNILGRSLTIYCQQLSENVIVKNLLFR